MDKALISFLLITIIFSCIQSTDTISYNNPVVWDESKASTNRVYDGIEYIQRAFDKFDIVAIGESHGVKQITDFYIELIKNDEFIKKVDVIIFELANSLYQEDLDNYILGKNNDTLKVKKLWREHSYLWR